MSDEQWQELQQLTDKMNGLCAQLEKVEGMSEAEEYEFMLQVQRVCSDMDDFSIIAFPPEVPEATQKMFYTLGKLFLHPKWFPATT